MHSARKFFTVECAPPVRTIIAPNLSRDKPIAEPKASKSTV
nr:hypothetical protein [Pleurocapsa sp. FMAR1]